MQDNLNYSWKQTTTDLYKAVKIYTFAAIAATIFGFIGSIGRFGSRVPGRGQSLGRRLRLLGCA